MDYNIYIHDKTNGQNKATEPKTNGSSNTTPKQNTSDSDASGANAGLTQAASKSTVGKVAIAVYVAYKVASTIYNTIEPMIARQTGDYRFSVWQQNVKQTLHNASPFNAYSYIVNKQHYYQENLLMNQRQEQQRLLVGDAYLNSISRKS